MPIEEATKSTLKPTFSMSQPAVWSDTPRNDRAAFDLRPTLRRASARPSNSSEACRGNAGELPVGQTLGAMLKETLSLETSKPKRPWLLVQAEYDNFLTLVDDFDNVLAPANMQTTATASKRLLAAIRSLKPLLINDVEENTADKFYTKLTTHKAEARRAQRASVVDALQAFAATVEPDKLPSEVFGVSGCPIAW